MTGLGIYLCVVGVVDLFRAETDATPAARLRTLAAGGALALLLVAVCGRPDGGWWAYAVAVVGLVGWVLLSGTALDRLGRDESGRRWTHGVPAAAAAALVLGGLAMFAAGDRVVGADAPGQPGWTDLPDVEPRAVLVVLGVLLVQVATANVAVRLLLDAVGVPPQSNEKTLKGGRALGPLERVFIVGAGAGGGLAAAAAVVAAKALLRFPEVRAGEQAHRSDPGQAGGRGPSEATEYFLIGSFGSWLLALGGVALISAIR